MASILTGIFNIGRFQQNNLKGYATRYLNRINAVGDQLEYYVKDAIANSFTVPRTQKEQVYQNIFSYLGNQNNPPDVIISQGDALEIKKLGSPNSILALNSSYPKDRLYRSDSRLTVDCKMSDGGKWLEKDIFYIVGYVHAGVLKHLFFVQGACYAADKNIYEKLHMRLKERVSSVIKADGLEGADTVELGRIRRVDPLGITEFRLRGMWEIDNPLNVFGGTYFFDRKKSFSLCALMQTDKYASYPDAERTALENSENATVLDVSVKNPNNPARGMPVKLITLSW